MSRKKNDTSKPLVDPKYMKRLFTDLENMIVDLDPDPLEFGPSRLTKKVQECRAFLNTVEREALAASRDLHAIKENYRALSKLYKLEEDKLLTNDPEVRAGRSIEDRRSVARMKLPEMVAELTWMEQGIEDLETALGWLKYKQSGLRNTQSQLKEQRNLCNEEIGLGRTWRNKNLPSTPLQPGQGRSAVNDSMDETDRILADLGDGEVNLPDGDGEEDTSEEDEDTSEEEEDTSEEEEGTDEAEEEEETGEEDEVELVPGMSADSSESDPGETAADESPDTLPVEEVKDPSEKVENTEDDILSFLDSPDLSEPKPAETDAAETEELDIDDLLNGIL